MTYPSHRRLFGLLLGALTGFVFMLVSQNINHLIMPEVPFYQPPFGPAGNTLLGLLIGGLLGLVTAWAEEGVKGIFYGSLTGALVIAVPTLLVNSRTPGVVQQRIIGMVLIFVPVAAMVAVVLFLLRWVIDREDTAYRESIQWRPPALLPRIALPVIFLLLVGLLGMTAMYNRLARTVTPRMQELIETGRQAQSPDQLPEALRGRDVHFFIEQAGQPYTLQWDRDESNQFAIGRPNTSPYHQSTVIARFENGYLLACFYPSPTIEPRCKDFAPETTP